MHPTVNPIQVKIRKSFFQQRKISIAPSYKNDNFLPNVCKNVDTYFQSPDKTILKRGRSSTVIKIPTDNKSSMVIRRDNFVSLFKFLKRGIRKSRSRKIWEKGLFMKNFGLKTITPIALIEDHIFMIRTGSYVLFEYIDGVTLKTYFSDPDISNNSKNNIADKLVRSIHKWHASGVTHGDPKASNIMIMQDEIYLIDVEDIKIPKWKWHKKHATARDKYIILHNWQKFSEQRDTWTRKLILEHNLDRRYFGKCLIKKFWKDEYSILKSSFCKNKDTRMVLKKTTANNFLFRWLNISPSKKETYALTEIGNLFFIVSKRAFFLIQSIESYFKKKRAPKKGILSITIALRACGFVLPDIVDGGLYRGVEYVIFKELKGKSVHSVWENVKNDNSLKHNFIMKLSEEIGRLHALGFVGLIQSLDSIFVKTDNDSFVIGYNLNSNARYHPGWRCRSLDKEINVIKTELLSQLPSVDSKLFWDNYKQIVP